MSTDRVNAVDIIGIGAQKSATSWAAHFMSLHANVWIPKTKAVAGKEVMFWDQHYGRGLDWYKKTMTPPQPEMKSMDVSPGYSRIGPHKVRQCYEQSPQSRAFLLLRNPVYRDWSSLVMEAELRNRLGLKDATFVDLMVYYDRFNVAQYTTYDKTFETWSKVYGNQLLVMLYDEIVTDPADAYMRLCLHCGLDPDAVPNWRTRTANRIFKGPDIELPKMMHEFLRKKHEPMIRRLETLLQKDLSDWLREEPRVR